MTANLQPACFPTTLGLTGSWSGSTTGGSVHFGGDCGGVSYSALSGEALLLVGVPPTAPPNGLLTLDTCTGTSFGE